MPFICSFCNYSFTTSNSVIIEVTCCKNLVHTQCYKEWKAAGRLDCFKCGKKLNAPHYHLSFNITDQEEHEVPKIKPQSAKENSDQLQAQINKIKIDLSQLQEKITVYEKSKKEIEDKYSEVQLQYAESAKTMEDLKQLIKKLINETEKIFTAFEHSKNILEAQVMGSACTEDKLDIQYAVLEETIKDLKQLILKLKCFDEDLKKEITNSIRLSIEKLKLGNDVEKTNNFPASDNGVKE